MGRFIEAIYEDGVLKPLEDPGLREHERILLDLRPLARQEAGSHLAGWQRVYEGLSEAEIDEVEAIALDRAQFFPADRS